MDSLLHSAKASPQEVLSLSTGKAWGRSTRWPLLFDSLTPPQKWALMRSVRPRCGRTLALTGIDPAVLTGIDPPSVRCGAGADTVNGRMLSKRDNRMHRFEALLGSLPADCVLDGEVVALDAAGRPMFADLMFGRRPPILVAFDVLVDRGEDARALPLARRKAVLRRAVIETDQPDLAAVDSSLIVDHPEISKFRPPDSAPGGGQTIM